MARQEGNVTNPRTAKSKSTIVLPIQGVTTPKRRKVMPPLPRIITHHFENIDNKGFKDAINGIIVYLSAREGDGI